MSTGQHSAWFALFIQLWEGPGGKMLKSCFSYMSSLEYIHMYLNRHDIAY